MKKMFYLKKLLPVLCLLCFSGCGYQLVGKATNVPPGISSIAIPTFKNSTFEPGIEIPFTQAFLFEMMSDKRVKVVNRSEADCVLEGAITYFYLISVTYNRSGLVQEYQSTVTMDLTLKKKTGEVLWIERGLTESRWFRASSNALTNEANKAAAIQQTAAFVAERIRNRFFYNF
jgi:outer membrane lipopolysaccharide assembly protein LptE/RlpB